jgi:hypothetical protein
MRISFASLLEKSMRPAAQKYRRAQKTGSIVLPV